MTEAHVVKLLYHNAAVKPRWVMAGSGRGLGPRDTATIFPDLKAAHAEAQIWKALSETVFSVIVEPA
jgi:hypothetical protein